MGYEYMYINHTTQKQWLQQRIESYWSKPDLSVESRQWILERLTAAEGMERYLHSRYVGQKRFSLEGGESLIVIMSSLVQRAGAAGCKEMVVGMARYKNWWPAGRQSIHAPYIGLQSFASGNCISGSGRLGALAPGPPRRWRRSACITHCNSW